MFVRVNFRVSGGLASASVCITSLWFAGGKGSELIQCRDVKFAEVVRAIMRSVLRAG